MCWFISCYQEWLSTGPRFFVFSVDEFWSYLHRLCSLWPIFSRQRATENHKKNWKLVLFFNDESYYFIIWYDESKFLFSCERRRKLARRWVVDFKFFNSTAYEHKHNIDNGISKLSYNKITHCQPKTSIIFYFNKNLCKKFKKFQWKIFRMDLSGVGEFFGQNRNVVATIGSSITFFTGWWILRTDAIFKIPGL